MMKGLGPLALALVITAATVPARAQADDLQANACSIVVGGDVISSTVNVDFCGVAQEALDRLIDQLEAANLARDEAIARANEWVERYYVLNERLAAVSDLAAAPNSSAAREFLEGGDLDRAEQEINDLEAAFETERQGNRDQMRTVLRELADAGVKPGGLVDYAHRWTESPITICFLNGTREVRQHVSRVARQWTLFGNIDFDFGSLLNPRMCSDEQPSQVRIDLSGPGFWSYVGNSHLLVRLSEPTMALPLNERAVSEIQSAEFDGPILHEFGHLLGLYHIYGHPDLDCKFDLDYVYDYLSGPPSFWSRQTIERNLLLPLRLEAVLVGDVDYRSIMQYNLPSEFFLDRENSPCYLPNPVRELSILDKLALYRTYPDR